MVFAFEDMLEGFRLRLVQPLQPVVGLFGLWKYETTDSMAADNKNA